MPVDRWRRPLLIAFALAVLAGAWWLTPDAAAERRVDAGLQRALASFATGRVLDAVVSAAQGTELSLQPLGVGVTLAPGEALDPVNDLIEQFCGLMLAASVAFGVQKLLIAAGAHWVLSALTSVAVVAWVAWRWRAASGDRPQGVLPGLLTRVVVVLLLLRFALPLAVLGADAGFRAFMADDYAGGQRALEASAGRLRELAPPAAEPAANEPGTLERLKRWWSQPAASGNEGRPEAPPPESRLEQWQRVANDAVRHVVGLIVVFAMQTLVLPLVTLWVLLALLKRAFGEAR
ncbi:MAG TPA: hypothetical protein VFR90_15030 [Methylibium sp.]|nr:hypothetical protein [Methylibium sp.]